ncbi:MAG: pilus assembly protein [Planctomycetes bacterium]|nr:pilus assembly protein [Planctomycetota bacterium]
MKIPTGGPLRKSQAARAVRRHLKAPARRGAVVVEMALALPLLFLLLFAGIEFSHTNVMRSTAENAAYEGARRGIVPGATNDDVRQTVQSILNIVNVKNAAITIEPAPLLPESEYVEVTIEIPMDSNGWIAANFMKGKTLRRSCRLARERFDFTSVP